MNPSYKAYLDSPAWKVKRGQRLEIARHTCSVCGQGGHLHVHHLTYANIFNERMEELLPLCELHHKLAEELYENGALTKEGEPLYLMVQTIRMLFSKTGEFKMRLQESQLKQARRNQKKRDNIAAIQNELLDMDWFVDALNQDRNTFKRRCRNFFLPGFPRRVRYLANAMALYQRRLRDFKKKNKRAWVEYEPELVEQEASETFC